MSDIINVKTSNLISAPNNPFRVVMDAEMELLIESISQSGVITPVIARAVGDDKYEIVSGHRRKFACDFLNIDTVPVVVRELDMNEAIVCLVDSNLQRENILPSEKAFAYKMKLDAIKHQGKASTQFVSKLRSDEIVGKDNNESRETVRRYIRLTFLIPELLKMVDDKSIAMSPAVELSSLPVEYQKAIYEAMSINECTPSYAQSIRLRKAFQAGELNKDKIFEILAEYKPNQLDHIRFRTDDIRKYFPKDYTDSQMQQTIIKLLDAWQKKRERNTREDR